MTRRAHVPPELALAPFRGSEAIRRGLLTWAMLRGPTWRRLLPDVYINAAAFNADDHWMWCRAVMATLGPGSAVGRHSAAFLWGLNLLPMNAPVSVTVPTRIRSRPHPRRSVTRAELSVEDVAMLGGLPVTTKVRTAFDLGLLPDRDHAIIALDAMCHARMVTLPWLVRYAEAKADRTGANVLRGRLRLVEPLSESPMETRVRLLLSDAGAPKLTAQYEVRGAGNRFIARVDLACPGCRIAIEYEGDHHRQSRQFRRDVARLNALRAAGWIVLRFTADDVLHRPTDVGRQVMRALRERGCIAATALEASLGDQVTDVTTAALQPC